MNQDETRLSGLVLLKPGHDPPPFFLTHGLGGNILEVADLAEHISCNNPVYGVQARGLVSAPDERIDDMVQFYFDEITRLQGRGPYLLAGLSIGGLVMLEVARRLLDKGEPVALLVLLDTFPPSKYWPIRSWVNVMIGRAREHARSLTKLPMREIFPQIVHLCGGLLGHIESRRKGALPRQKKSRSEAPTVTSLQSLRNAYVAAIANYRPQYYDGRVVFLKSEVSTRFPR